MCHAMRKSLLTFADFDRSSISGFPRNFPDFSGVQRNSNSCEMRKGVIFNESSKQSRTFIFGRDGKAQVFLVEKMNKKTKYRVLEGTPASGFS